MNALLFFFLFTPVKNALHQGEEGYSPRCNQIIFKEKTPKESGSQLLGSYFAEGNKMVELVMAKQKRIR